MLRAFAARSGAAGLVPLAGSLVAGALAASLAAGCRNYDALDRLPGENDASQPRVDASTLHVDAGGPVDGSGSADLGSGDAALASCSEGVLCETFDNDPIGDEWVASTTGSGTAVIDKTEAHDGPSSLRISVPSLGTNGSADPGYSHAIDVSFSPVVHIRELFYFPSTLGATVDLVRLQQAGSGNELRLQATPQDSTIQLTLTSSAGGAASSNASVALDQWNCVEWALSFDVSPSTAALKSTVTVNNSQSSTSTNLSYPFAAAPDTIALGDSIAAGPYLGATYWIDSLVVTAAAGVIGCP